MSLLRFPAIHIAFFLFLVVLATSSGCGRKEDVDLSKSNISSDSIKETKDLSKPKSEEILATIGDEVITIDDYKKEIAMLPSNYRAMANQNKKQMLQGLINKQLLLREAKRKNLQNSDDVKRLLEKVKEEIMVQELIDKEVSDKTELTDSEIEKYYHENKTLFMEPPKIRACHILVDSEVLTKKILSDLESGVSFEKLAKEYSLDTPTKDKGGDLGYFAKGTLLVEFEGVCEKSNIGEISEVKTPLGYHIVKVLDKKEGKLKTLEEVKGEIKSELLLDKELELYNKLLQQLREDQEITVNNQLLDSLDLSQID